MQVAITISLHRLEAKSEPRDGPSAEFHSVNEPEVKGGTFAQAKSRHLLSNASDPKKSGPYPHPEHR